MSPSPGLLIARAVGKAAPAAPFSPTDLPNLQVWAEARFESYADNDPVGTATDHSGGSHHLTQATAGKKPLFKTGIVNGQPVYRFDGTDDLLKYGNALLAQPATVFLVAAYRGARVGNDTLCDGGLSDNGMRLYRSAANTLGTYAGAFGPTVSPADITAFHVYSAVFNGASSVLRLDSATDQTGNSGSANNEGVTLAGTGGGAPVAEFGPIDVAAVVLYQAALSGGNRESVRAFLAAVYGL